MMSTFVDRWDRDKDLVGAAVEGVVNLFMPSEEAIQFGHVLAARLLASPYDIVVLNELFHADARETLTAALTSPALPNGVRYPWVRNNFGETERTPSGNPQPGLFDILPDFGAFPGILEAGITALRYLLDDSGLYIASRLPLERFQLDGTLTDWAFARYSSARGIDAIAPKGAAAVVVKQANGRRAAVTFTHMQADDGSDTYWDTRRRQFAQLRWLALGTAKAAGASDIVVMGDLNVHGEVDPKTGAHHGEYEEVFGPTGSMTTHIGPDGWRHGSWAPAPTGVPAPGLFDPAHSYRGMYGVVGDEQRLDYIIAGSVPGASDFKPCVSHLMIGANLDDGQLAPETPIGLGPVDLAAPRGFAHLSDHLAVNAIIGTQAPAATPRSALAMTPGPGPETFAHEFLNVEHGELRWAFLEPGAYRLSIHENMGKVPAPIDLEVFDPRDLGASLVSALAEEPTGADQKLGIRYPATDFPLLVRTHARIPGHEQIDLRVRRIFGAKPSDAIPLHPWMPTAPMPWPTPAQGGRPDRARWFEVGLKSPEPGTAQTIRFGARMASGTQLTQTFEIFAGTTIHTPESQLTRPSATLIAGDHITITGTQDHELRFLVRTTPAPGFEDVDTIVDVESDLRFLLGAAGYAFDETGTDWMGDDEIIWDLTTDLAPTVPSFTGQDPDVNTGETFTMVQGRLAFRNEIHVTIREDGGAAGDETARFVLPGNSPPDADVSHVATLPDDVRDGRYGVLFRWTRRLANSQ